jgi:hypothetical protein
MAIPIQCKSKRNANQFNFEVNYLLSIHASTSLLVQGLGVGGGGGDVSVTGGLVGAGGLLQSGGILEVGATSGVVGLGVAGDEVESEKGEHGDVAYSRAATAASFASRQVPAAAAADAMGGHELTCTFDRIMTSDNATLRHTNVTLPWRVERPLCDTVLN